MFSFTYLLYIFSIVFSIQSVIYFYKYLTRNHEYWLIRGVKGPWPIPLFGTFIYFMLYKRSEVDVQWFKKYGKIYGLFDGNIPVLSVCEPKLIKQILVKDFHIFSDRNANLGRHPIIDKNLFILNGDDWKRVRSIVGSTFTQGKLNKMYPLIKGCLKEFMSALQMRSKDGKDVNMKELYGLYTMDVIATCAFGIKTDFYNNHNNVFSTNANEAFAHNYWAMLANFTLPTILLKYFQLSILPFGTNQSREYFFGIIRGIMKERKQSKNTFNDFIELMMNLEKREDNVRDDNDINESLHVNESEEELEIEKKTYSGVEKYVTENEIIANAQVFLTEGYETTSTTLSHCTQELALNTEIQEKLYSEVKSSVDSEEDIDYNLLSKLPYLDAVISETLRLHSPVPYLKRIAAIDYKLGDTGITIMKGQSVEMPIFPLHRCEEYYPNADQFIPERFLPENRHKIIPYTYFPFGAGPRNCIGMRLALLTAKLALAHVILNYKIVRSINTDIPMLLSKSIALNIPQRIIVKINKRD